MYDIITIGSATRDVFVCSKALDIHTSKHVVSGLEACLPLGAKINVEELVFDTGGGATNTAFSLSRLGLKVAPVCEIGKDYAGQEIIKVLKRAGVDTRFITLDRKEPTAYSIILLAGTGERTILVYRGASGKFDAKTIPWNKLNSSWLYVSSLGGDLKLFERILKIAKKRKIKIAWNPGGQEIKMGLEKLKRFIQGIDVLLMNQEEALTLCKTKNQSLEECLKALGPLPQRALAITQGKKGAIVADKKEILYAPVLDFKVVNTTGAGDAFSSGFITGLIHWDDLGLALRLGILNSSMCVTKMGAKAGLLSKLPNKKQLIKLSIKRLDL